jgi:hypothetical protein
MLFLFPSRYRHFILLVGGATLLVFGLVAAGKGATLLGGIVLVWGLVRTTSVLRGARRSTDIASGSGR